MARALILGGTGMIGTATARHLVADGWEVDVTGRDPAHHTVAEARFVRADRAAPDQLRAAVGDGVDLLVDCICYTAEAARTLVPLAGHATSTVMISSKAVYVDAAGNHSNSDVEPDFGGPIPETQPTVRPREDIDYDSREGYGANKVAAEHVLRDSGLPITIVRPSRVYGSGADRPREWALVKRILDRRPVLLLADRGAGTVHPTAAGNIAALVAAAAAHPGARILNSADPDAPSALEISRIIARQLGHTWDEVLLDDDSLGAHPWQTAHPVILDLTAAAEIGYRPVGDYAMMVAEEVDWLVRTGSAGDEAYFERFFDYAAEDAYVSGAAREAR
jgi:nucleoside-diphosphate-sugar epimerase